MEKKYKSEAEVLENYDASKFDKLSATTDILIFSVASSKQENYRKLNNKHFDFILKYINQIKNKSHEQKCKHSLHTYTYTYTYISLFTYSIYFIPIQKN